MEIITAKTAGFCRGVRRAVRLAEEAAAAGKKCVTLGPIIHNRSVVEMLASKGVGQINNVSEAEAGQTVILRSHGVGKTEYEELIVAGAEIIDATCPDVESIHDTVRRESADGRTVVIFGEREHPEVAAIAGWCGEYAIIENESELDLWLSDHAENKNNPISVVFQTTGNRNKYKLCVKKLKKECTNIKIFDTICNATSKRQQEAAQLSAVCDAMIVIGGRNSANSKRLAEICEENCARVYFVEDADELSTADFTGVQKLGITAGASTPAWIIKEVNQKMCDEMNVNATVEIPESQSESFEEMLEKSIKTLHTGEKVIGVIAAITPTEVSVDLGTKQSGYIPIGELTDDPSAKVEDIVKIGDEIETYVMRVNDVEGTVMLSKKRLDSAKAWEDVINAKNTREVLEGVVVEENKGGIVVSVRGVRVFVPASQSGLPKDAPLSPLMKTKVKLRITEVNQPRRRVVGSIRAVSSEERKSRAEAIWNEIEEGKRYSGVVKSLTSYGAFVDIGGIDGMVHVSELSWNRVRQPSDILNVGDAIDVFVISFDKEKRKISLGCKNPEDNPWVRFTTQYAVDSVASVKIVKLMPFGAFAEVLPGVDGLIHISQIADRRIGKPEEVLSVGQVVDAKIVEIDNEKQKISLSIRALLAPQESRKAAADVVEEDTGDAVVYDTENPIPVEDDAE